MCLKLLKTAADYAKKALYIIYKAGDNAVEHDGIEHAGFLSFMGILAIFPFLVFFVAILGVLGQTGSGADFVQNLIENAPPNILAAIKPRIEEILNGPPQALLTVSILGTLWTSSSLVDGLRVSLNKAYHVYTPPNYWLRRVISILQIVILVLILVLAMFALVLTPIIYETVYGFIASFNAVAETVGGSPTNLNIQDATISSLTFEFRQIRIVAIVAAMIFFVSALYYFLPNVKQNWLKTLPGAIIAGIGWFYIGRGLSYYLAHFNQVNLIYGSLASVIAFLVFFYLINLVVIYGAEFNYLLEKSLGGKVKQKQKVNKKDVRAYEKDNRKEESEEIT